MVLVQRKTASLYRKFSVDYNFDVDAVTTPQIIEKNEAIFSKNCNEIPMRLTVGAACLGAKPWADCPA